jgi:aspartyl-tRNA(Asn)/glutamyl-tRNA(Gln) amidotransferase subunit A
VAANAGELCQVTIQTPNAKSLQQLADRPLHEASEMVKTRAVSPVELTRACLERIEQLNPTINAFITVTGESAMAEARAAEEEIGRGGWRGLLHGIPIALKDLIDTAGVRTTAASELFRERVPRDDAEVVRRLKSAGAVLLGKTNLHEFAYGGSSLISAFGPVRNPRNPEHVAGGSSSGSAAAVACGMCYAAIGTDTAGSIRLPASCCGVVGLKPTYGRVSARGVIPLAWSYDHVGPLTRTVRDAAIVLQAIAGYDALDLTSCDLAVSDYTATLDDNVEALRIGVVRDFFFADLEPAVEQHTNAAIEVLARITHAMSEVSFRVDEDRTVFGGEQYCYHAPFVAEHSEQYQPETLRRIRTGADISTVRYIEKKRELEQMRRAAGDIFRDVDLLITPTSPISPPTIASLQSPGSDLRKTELVMLRNTRPFNVLGLPAISVPCGTTSEGLPVGLQISGPPGGEARVLQLATAYERSRPES